LILRRITKMDIKLVNRGDTGELLMSGDLDTKTARDADMIFSQMADRFKNLTLNMKDLEYISSSGLRSIRNLYIKVNQNGGKLVLTNVNENVMEVFEMTGLAGLLNIR
jgi:anti-sigma B factor antagonist